jgi:SH3 domain-containing YSC84-like protein 1
MRLIQRFFIVAFLVTGLNAPARSADTADQLIAAGTETLATFMDDERWTSIRNALGGSRGVFVVPSIKKVGLILGIESGTGLLMARHGDRWSEPVIIDMSNQSAGFQAGAQDAELLMVVMADGTMENLAGQNFGIGTTGGISVGDLGIGGGGTGGFAEGVATLIAYKGKGLFGGGGFQNTRMQINEEFNKDLHGATGPELKTILEEVGSNARSKALRDKLVEAVRISWYGK